MHSYSLPSYHQVCGSEFPDVCSECNPSKCGSSGGGGQKCTGCSWDGAITCPDWYDYSAMCLVKLICFTLILVLILCLYIQRWCNESQSNCNICTGSWYGGNGGGAGIDIRQQGSSTVQVVNQSSETNLHVFFQSNNVWEKWVKVGGNGVINNPINWGQDGTNAFDPLGAKKLSEAVIPKGGNIILTIPNLNPPQFQIIAIKMVDPGRKEPLPPSKASDWNGPSPKEVIRGQWPVLIGKDRDVTCSIRIHSKLNT